MNFAHCRVLCWPALWILLCLASGLQAAILRVPADFPGIQAAMDSSSPGDTVHVAPGTWYGLHTSPTHGLTLCSDYLFTQDSTDINETILDGEYAGTIFDLICENEWFTLCGFTLQNGLGQQLSNGSYCHRAGAVQMNPWVSAEIRDTVFRGNRAPQAASVLFMGTICSVASSRGGLKLINVACYDNVNENPTGGLSTAILLRPSYGQLVIDGLYYDGGGSSTLPFYASVGAMDSVYLNDIHVMNCLAERFLYTGFVTSPHGQVITNLRSTDARGPNTCSFYLNPFDLGSGPTTTTYRNVVQSGLRNPMLFINGDTGTTDISGVTIERCRYDDPDVTTASNLITAEPRGTLRNLHMHHNVNGDSTNAIAKSNLEVYNFDIDSVWVHDNRSTVPPHPSPSTSGGNSVDAAMLIVMGDSSYFLRNLLFENNRVDDLDDYSNHSPQIAYESNKWREIAAFSSSGTLSASNIRVRNSRQPNHCPEVYSEFDIDLAQPGYTVGIVGNAKAIVNNVIIEDSDDGGLSVGAEDSVLVSNVALRNVGRVAIKTGTGSFPTTYPYSHFSNILVDNVDASDNFLPPQYQSYSNQAVFFCDVTGDFIGVPPRLVIENMTVKGCDGMRHLFNFYQPVDLVVRNCLFWNNAYLQLVEWNLPITQTWEYSILQEPVPGIGNQVGVDPWFDEELGAPWLSPISPAIDAGHPDQLYNDVEDSDNPGYALWPSQGTLRNDIGYTGGPHLFAIDTSWVALQRPKPRPAALPQGYTLHPAHPNPFNPSTTVSYSLARPMQVELSVYNLLGQQVRTLAFGQQDAGEHSVPFTAGELASGVYVVELQAGGHSQTQKVLLLK